MKSRKPTKQVFEFTLVLEGIQRITRELEDDLFEAGCDDATLSARSGRVFLAFARSAATLREAVVSAIHAVQAAKIQATVLRVDSCGLVTQADIARKINRSRQQVHQYVSGLRGPGGFPPPACNISDGVPLWNWSEVAQWMCQHDIIQPAMLLEAQELAAVNCVLELNYQRQVAPELTNAILQALGTP